MNIFNEIKYWVEDVYWNIKWKIVDTFEHKNIEPFVGEEFVEELKPKNKRKTKKAKKNK